MTEHMTGRHFLKEADFTPAEWVSFVNLAGELKAERAAGREQQRLAGKAIALIFEKTSTRTRAAFEVAAVHQGAATTYLDTSASQIGHKESIEDTARVLGRMYDAIEFRGDRQADVELLAESAGVPVYNGLTDDWHPTQMLADALTIREHVKKPFSDVISAYVGDARFNTGRSFLISAAMLGQDVRIIAPSGYEPPADVVELAESFAKDTGARITITDSLNAVEGADAISTDVWVSMGEAKEVWSERIGALLPYQVNAELMKKAPDAVFMHCLPAFHDQETAVGREVYEAFNVTELEVTDEVFRSPASVVFDQAENRLHTIKAVMVSTLS
ncbi:ornithine carbamoyltransferase [Flaviflexus ciconiae]|uniref:Ornithine carbamoyltransferase n=1 Tax=Flaviflexus ciconiae TaxID=2496867 RepID=A0A3Q9G730_9ACTO|nr:ornithine carbamoyltransferase [Flaviflexus ciconiae]AZQ76647.1 ornithine carbamoyltransferase [Flaviflexus ciconiae]